MRETQSGGRRLAVGRARLYTAPFKFNGMDVVFDPDMPPNEARLVDASGKVLVSAKVPELPAEEPSNG